MKTDSHGGFWNRARRAWAAGLCFLCLPLLGGCPALLVAGGTGTAMVANDSRTAGSVVEDEVIETKAFLALRRDLSHSQSADYIEIRPEDGVLQMKQGTTGDLVNISVISYNRRPLMVGQAPTSALRARAEQIVRGIANVRADDVVNQVEVAGPSSLATRAADTLLTARVKSVLCTLRDEGFSCLSVKVVTERGTVYLLGLLTRPQAAVAVEAVRRIPGVLRVARFFEYQGE